MAQLDLSIKPKISDSSWQEDLGDNISKCSLHSSCRLKTELEHHLHLKNRGGFLATLVGEYLTILRWFFFRGTMHKPEIY